MNNLIVYIIFIFKIKATILIESKSVFFETSQRFLFCKVSSQHFTRVYNIVYKSEFDPFYKAGSLYLYLVYVFNVFIRVNLPNQTDHISLETFSLLLAMDWFLALSSLSLLPMDGPVMSFS